MRKIMTGGEIFSRIFLHPQNVEYSRPAVNNPGSYNSIFFDRMKETKKLDVLADEGNSDNYTNDVIQYRAASQQLSRIGILL